MLQFQHLVLYSQVLGLVLSPLNVQLQSVLRGLLLAFCRVQRVRQLPKRRHRVVRLFKAVQLFVGLRHIEQSVQRYRHVFSCFQGLERLVVQLVVVKVHDIVHSRIAPRLLPELLKLLVVLVEGLQVYLLLGHLRIGETDVRKRYLSMGVVEVRLFQRFLRHVHHLSELIIVVVQSRQSQIVCRRTLLWKVLVHVVNTLLILLLQLVVHIEEAQERSVRRGGAIQAKLTIVRLGIVTQLLQHGLPLLAVLLSEGEERLIRPSPVEGLFVARSLSHFFQLVGRIHESLKTVSTVEPIHLRAQVFQLRLLILRRYRKRQ